MKLNKRVFLLSILSLFFIIGFVYATATKYESIMNLIIGTSLADSTDEMPGTVTSAQDLSSSFNERGYTKSNSYSIDEKEIINDFNGNLMYRIPIASGKDQGDLSYEFTLNYNGNVNYTVITADITTPYYNFGQLHQYNVSAPGWILSLNGMAVQMINFESNYFTRGTNNVAKGREVRLLANGYNITDMLTTASTSNHDKITIMLGDGSTETLEKDYGVTGYTDYTGWYKSISKNDYWKAFVKFTNATTGNAGTDRTMYLMRGDGLTFIYEETSVSYNDHYKQTSGGMAPWFYPQSFLLTGIKDRFGHGFGLEYDILHAQNVGRPNLTYGPGFHLEYPEFWGTHFGVKIYTKDGSFTLYTEPYNTNGSGLHRPKFEKMVNPSGETMQFSYQGYLRTGTDLYNDPTHNNLTIKFGGASGGEPLNRISQVVNYNGGKRIYEYASPQDLTMSYYVDPAFTVGAHSDITYFFGQGRDQFFSNMLSQAKTKIGSDYIRQDDFTYTYSYPTRNLVNVWMNPVDANDEYYTHRATSSLFSTYNNSTPTTKKTVKLYRNFVTKAISSAESVTEYTGTIKLVSDSYYHGSNNTLYKTLTYTYNVGAILSGVFQGSFLDSLYTENYNDVTRRWQYDFTFPSSSNNIPYTGKTEIDPLNQVTQTSFTNFEKYAYTVFESASYKYPTSGQAFDNNNYFYLTHQPNDIQISKGSTVLKHKKILYYFPDEVYQTKINGYYGQDSIEQDINPSSNNVLRQISYKYYNQDTTGYYLHFGGFSNPDEGNIKEITDANGNRTHYYYNLVSRKEQVNFNNCSGSDEEFCPPWLSYKKKKDDGTDTLLTNGWSDYRFPSRIDRYLSLDTLKNYQLYNEIGAPSQIINENNYLSTFTYDKYYRLNTATLPYDFNYLSPQTTQTITNSYFSVEIVSNSSQWGHRDILGTPYQYIGGLDNVHNTEMSIQYNTAGTSSNDFKRLEIARFTNPTYTNIVTVDSAFLEFSPAFISAKFDNSPITNFSIFIKPLKHVSGTGTSAVYSEGVGSQDVGNLDATTSESCSSLSQIEQNYASNFRKIDITSLLNSNVTNGTLQIEGLLFDAQYNGTATGFFDCHMQFYKCTNFNGTIWLANYAPRLRIYTTKNNPDTARVTNYYNGTLIYNYDDLHDTITSYSKIDKVSGANRNKIITYKYDAFNKLIETKLYSGYNIVDTKTDYNYLDLKGRTKDGYGNYIKYSYDENNNLSKTQFPDDSVSLIANSYQSSLSSYFGNTYSGFINRQTFTDETKRVFNKYFDAAGNLLREEKFMGDPNVENEDNPYDPDTTASANGSRNPNYTDDPSGLITIATDYLYDDLYRLIQVHTAEGKNIYYSYDILGRQKQRITPDAGTTNYSYDKNDNLLYSQDANQYARGHNVFTFRTYDGINRMLTLGETNEGGGQHDFEDLDPESSYDFITSTDNLYIVNVYDSLVYAPVTSFFTAPTDYGSNNNIKGKLVATAFRTRLSDSWNYKYYRYDARGRVIKMWTYLNGLGWKSENYYYNSQNQIVNNLYQYNATDGKLFKYTYDNAARLEGVQLFTGATPVEPGSEGDNPSGYLNLTGYKYNTNSQDSTQKFNGEGYKLEYVYNNRNWVQQINNDQGKFRYVLYYNANGNIRYQGLQGSYKSNFSDNNEQRFMYIYDRSNRLVKTDETNYSNNGWDLINTYDKDGNFKKLKRYDQYGNVTDDYSYSYINETNKLQSVGSNSYEYDANGNVITDGVDNIHDMKYDYRNLLIELQYTVQSTLNYRTKYYYDEAGNRVKKLTEQSDNFDSWTVVSTTYYVRDLNGKEIAIYDGTTLQQWNMWGLDNIGKINSDNKRYFYLKDHLGTVRGVIDTANNVVSAQDYDAWGYLMQNRSYQSTNNIYKFTSKERDVESSYDYFGARYYDSRIGRWGGVEPNYDLSVQQSPYNYSINNPTRLADDNGKWPKDGQRNLYMTTDADRRANALEIGNRISAGYEKLFSGDLSGALNQMYDNALHSYGLVMGLIPPSPQADFGIVGLVKEAPNMMTTLFRAVEEAELSSIVSKGRYSLTPEVIGKYFWTEEENANWFVKQMSLSNKKSYWITESKISSLSLEAPDVTKITDANKPGYLIGSKTLQKLSPPQIHNSIGFK